MIYAKLWKRILHGGCIHPPLKRLELEPMERQVLAAPIIVDSRLLIVAVESRRKWRWPEFNHLALPFDRFWVEGADDNEGLWGALVSRFPQSSHVSIRCFVATGNSQAILCGDLSMEILEQGGVVPHCRNGDPFQVITHGHPRFFQTMMRPDGTNGATDLCLTVMDNVCDLLQLLGCSNIGLNDKPLEPRDATRLAKRQKGNPDYYRYHTVVVRDPKNGMTGTVEEVGNMPRHEARGHYQEYGPEFRKGLLFGKYAGRFWIPPYRRGKLENGRVEKDYLIARAS